MRPSDDDRQARGEYEVASFQIRYRRLLAPDGSTLDQALPDWAEDRVRLREIYRAMWMTRTFDAKALSLQRTGKLGTFGSPLGQEAIGVGVASAMLAEDVMLPSYREIGAQLWRGVAIGELLLYWGGDERGSDYAGPREDFPVCVPIATHALHAVGVAYAFKLRGQARAAVCFLGDGATSKGDFYEAVNAAGVWQLPLLFVVSNNQWAISVPIERQTACATLAQKAIAGGFAGEQVDGNDLFAVHQAAARALQAAREGGGPHLIEALTYRMGDHTTADDASRYRKPEEVEAHRRYDPISRLRRYMEARELWSDAEESALLAECAAEVEAATETYLRSAAQEPGAMFDHLHAELPAALQSQRRAARREGLDDG